MKKQMILLANIFIFSQCLFAENMSQVIPKGHSFTAPLPLMSVEKKAFTAKTADITVFEETFESTVSSWSITSPWSVGTPTSGPKGGYSSTKCAATNLSGNYSNSLNIKLITPSITLPTVRTGNQLVLRFNEWYQTESSYDYGKVEISTDGGSSWTLLTSRSGTSDWRQTEINLLSYSGRQVKISFTFTSDSSVSYNGWFIDNVKVIQIGSTDPLDVKLENIDAGNWPYYIYSNITVSYSGAGITNLPESNVSVYENGIRQTNHFSVTPPASGEGVRLADIIFVLDVTGSMYEEITGVKNNMLDFLTNLASSGINYNVGFVVFGDSVYVYNDGNLYSDITQITTTTRNITLGEHGIGDGGDTPENQLEAMVRATRMNFRPGSQKILIMLTDAEPHEQDAVTTWSRTSVITYLRSAGVVVYPIFDTSDSDETVVYIPIAQALNSQGAYYDNSSNFNDIITQIGRSITSTYVVTYSPSNTSPDGKERSVEFRVTYEAYSDTVRGTYTPNQAPRIERTSDTIALETSSWPEGTSFTIKAQIIDTVAPYVQNATLYYRKTGASTYNSTAMTVKSGSIYEATLPGSAAQKYGLDYYIQASDGKNSTTAPKVYASVRPFQIAILPNYAPAITHTPVASSSLNTPIQINAQITDSTNRVSSALLYYRNAGQLDYVNTTMSLTSGITYSATIPASYATSDNVEYFIYASDDLGTGATKGTFDSPYLITISGETTGVFSITVENVSTTSGDLIFVPITVQNGSHLFSASVKYSFTGSDLDFVGITNGTGFPVEWKKDASASTVQAAYLNSNGFGAGSLLLSSLTFYVKKGSGTTSISIHTDSKFYDANGSAVTPETHPGTVTVTSGSAISGSRGDMNNDSVNDVRDALYILRMSIHAPIIISDSTYTYSYNPTLKYRADVNGDGTIRANDAIPVLQKFLGITTTLYPTSSAGKAASPLPLLYLERMDQVAPDNEMITVSLKGNTIKDFAGSDLVIDYDSHVLSFADISLPAPLKGMFCQYYDTPDQGTIRISMASAKNLACEGDEILKLQFRRNEPFTDRPGSIHLKEALFWNEHGKNIGVETGGEIAINFNSGKLPQIIALEQNTPNPFNPVTTIQFRITDNGPRSVTFSIYDVRGTIIRTLLRDVSIEGLHSVVWDGKDNNGKSVSAGMYFYSIQSGSMTKTRKMMLIK